MDRLTEVDGKEGGIHVGCCGPLGRARSFLDNLFEQSTGMFEISGRGWLLTKPPVQSFDCLLQGFRCPSITVVLLVLVLWSEQQ
jgi:hypothetical protein